MFVPKLADTACRFAGEQGKFLLFITPENRTPCGSIDWFVDHREELLTALDHFGVLYFRDFGADSHRFEAIADVLAPGTMPYMGGVSPRRFVHGTVFTANDAPGPLPVVQHHELAYHGSTPRYVFFYCDLPPESGGATPVSDGRLLGHALDADSESRRVMDKLEETGVVFIRNYTAANFKSWQETWQTTDRAELENRLRATSTEWEWLADDWLRTRQRRTAVVRDPVSGQRILYATINIWHRSFAERVSKVYNLPLPDDVMVQPFASVFGDGSPIPNEFVQSMGKLHGEQMVTTPYHPQDFMIINNFIATHGKTPWTGTDRRVYVTMREPLHWSELKRLPARRVPPASA
jgi:alpha-ketoglutarate-dependent taurine dioxygenase